jgi:hypothetical protein
VTPIPNGCSFIVYLPSPERFELAARLVRVEDGAEVPAAETVHELVCMAIGWVRVFDLATPR